MDEMSVEETAVRSYKAKQDKIKQLEEELVWWKARSASWKAVAKRWKWSWQLGVLGAGLKLTPLPQKKRDESRSHRA